MTSGRQTDARPVRRVVLSGCSGGGKTTLLAELGRRGYVTVGEPGRRIVKDQLASGGTALPWENMAEFARLCVDYALADIADTAHLADQWVFFDRGLIDAATAVHHYAGVPALLTSNELASYNRNIFLVPPWSEIYAADDTRRHSFDAAIAEYHRLRAAFTDLGYTEYVLPRDSVAARADLIAEKLQLTRSGTH